MADVICDSDNIALDTGASVMVLGTTLRQTSSPDVTTVSGTLYDWTSWTTRHTLSSGHLPIVTTVDMRHDGRLQQSRRSFANCWKAGWTQFADFAQTAMPTSVHTANRIFAGMLMADKHSITGAGCTATAGSYPTMWYAGSHRETTYGERTLLIQLSNS